MEGFVHSTESFGTVDGPGVRFVVFTQGCPMRCKYCHNPDTWQPGIGNKMSTDQIIKEYNRNRSFYSKGGLTVTGGEPLVQIDFVLELFAKAKKEGIHTCLDTSGITFTPDHTEKFEQLMKVTDLVMLDIKHIDPKEHQILCQQPNHNILEFVRFLAKQNVTTWIRHVVVPTITDNDEYLERLGYFIGEFKNIKALDVLPYHTMGIVKYENLGMEYPLKGLQPLPKQRAEKARDTIIQGMKKKRAEMKKESV